MSPFEGPFAVCNLLEDEKGPLKRGAGGYLYTVIYTIDLFLYL